MLQEIYIIDICQNRFGDIYTRHMVLEVNETKGKPIIVYHIGLRWNVL